MCNPSVRHTTSRAPFDTSVPRYPNNAHGGCVEGVGTWAPKEEGATSVRIRTELNVLHVLVSPAIMSTYCAPGTGWDEIKIATKLIAATIWNS